VFGFISTILLFPNILTTDQYGLTRVLLSVALVSSQFAQLGMNNVIIRFFPYYQRSDEARHRLLTLAFLVPLAGFLLFLMLFFIFRDPLISYYSGESELIVDYYLYLIPLVFSILFFEVLNSYVRALKDSITGSVISEVLVRILVIGLLIFHYFDWFSFREFMLIFTAIYSIQPVCIITYLIIKKELSFSMPYREETRRLLKGMSVYGAYSLLGGLASLLIGNIDIIMISAMMELNNTAVYAIAFYIGSVIAIPQRSISKIATPVVADLIKNKQFGRVEKLYQRTALNQLIAGSLVFIGVWANLHNVTDLLPEEYVGIYWVVVVVGLAKLINMATGVNGHIIMNSRFYRYDLYTNILLLVLTIGTNLLLIPVYGIVGAALATAISIFVYNFVKFLIVWVKFDMQPFQWNAGAIVGIAAVCLYISEQIPYMINFFVDVTVRSLIILLLFTSAVILFRLSEDFQNLALESLKRLKIFRTQN
jgi:O-antigen/teichoic acid export membrane protein